MNPTFEIEKKLANKGNFIICGIDEAGRGAWAGPVVVGAAIFKTHKIDYRLRDSKKVTEEKRYQLFNKLNSDLLDFSIGLASHQEIDNFGMTEALKVATKRCLDNLKIEPDFLMLDGNYNYLETKIKSKTYIRGDAQIASICAAGIIAKTIRDKMMHSSHLMVPKYQFHINKGYGTCQHKKLIDIYGKSSFHRESFNITESWTKK